jgi:hypothetical protein
VGKYDIPDRITLKRLRPTVYLNKLIWAQWFWNEWRSISVFMVLSFLRKDWPITSTRPCVLTVNYSINTRFSLWKLALSSCHCIQHCPPTFCFIYALSIHRSPLWSSGQSSELQIRRPGLDSRH